MDLAKVEDFMKQEARPWALNDIYSKGFKDFPKNTVKNSLDILVKKKKIIVKENVYCYNFKHLPAVNNDADEVRQRVKKYIKKVKEKEEHLEYLEKLLSNNNEEIPIAVLENELNSLTKRVDELKIKADEIKGLEINDIKTRYDTCLREFSKRKIIGSTMLGTIMEVCSKPEKVVLDDAEVETDEMAGFNIADFPVSNNKII